MANTTNFTIEKPSVGGARNSWGGIANVGTDKIDELLALAMPLGTIQMYPLATAPTATTNGGEWLLCAGGSLARVGVYQPLFALIGTTYGIGSSSDSSTFSLPDLRARVPVGYNSGAIGSGVTVRSIRAIASTTGGTEGHIITEGELAAHSHPIPATTHDHDIDPVTHAHVGLREDAAAGTEDATLAITDPGHVHGINAVPSWGTHTIYAPEWGPGPSTTVPNTNNAFTAISIADHKHTFATDAVGHGITTTETEVIGITSTAPDTGSSASHNNMQPYITVQYIILAKHPTF
jgi:microcystin-dependent protein